MRNPKARANDAMACEAAAPAAKPGEEQARPKETAKPETPLVGIDAIAAFLGRGRTTIIDWRQTFSDFPVDSDKYSVWVSTKERLSEWKERHSYLFRTRQELQKELQERKHRRW